MKKVMMKGADDGFLEIPSVANQNLQTRDCYGIVSIPPDMVKWASVGSKQSLEIK